MMKNSTMFYEDDDIPVEMEACPISAKALNIKIESIDNNPNLEAEVNIEFIPIYDTISPCQSTTLTTLVRLETKEEEESTSESCRAPIDLICVIDKSGSMFEGNKLELVKKTIIQLMEQLNDRDRLSIVSFNSIAERLIQLVRMTAENKELIKGKLKEIKAFGETNISDGIYHSLEILKQRKHINEISTIFLLSDGLDKEALIKTETLLKEYNDKIKDSFTINTFGYGDFHDPDLMMKIACMREGSFYFIDKLNTINEAMLDCLGGILSVVNKNIELTVSANDNSFLDKMFNNKKIFISKVYGPERFWKIDNSRQFCSANLSHLISGKKYHLIIEFEIPGSMMDFPNGMKVLKLATVVCKTNSIYNRKSNILESDCKVFVDRESTPEINKEVLLQYHRVESANILLKAKNLSESNNFKHAEEILIKLKNVLSNTSLSSERFIQNLAKDVESAIVNIKPEFYKKNGRKYLYEGINAQITEKSNIHSNVDYSNKRQLLMRKMASESKK